MTNLLTLLAECECWLGIEPTDEAQVAEVAELRERVRRALDGRKGAGVEALPVTCSTCGGPLVTPNRRGPCEKCFPAACMPAPASEKEPLPKTAASFLDRVAAKRGIDGLE